MEVKVQDLEVGDIVLLLGQVSKCVRIITKPILGATKQWRPNDPWYKSMNVQVNMAMQAVIRTRWDYKTKAYIPYSFTEKVFILDTPPVDAPKLRVDLNYNRMWLVERTRI
jgi:hypothetical protein